MHQTLSIPELFRYIFVDSHNEDLAVLARTCRAFKEPALDLLWEKLDGLSPLVRCLPDACCLEMSIPAKASFRSFLRQPHYNFCRPLNEVERSTLRNYARRVQVIYKPKNLVYLTESVLGTLFYLEPLTYPLFPNLRSLYWELSTAIPAHHVAVPSLTSLHLDLPHPGTPVAIELFDVLAGRCPHMMELVVHRSSHPEDETISRQICRWTDLHRVDCKHVTLNVDAITHLSSIPNLNQLLFTVEMDVVQQISHLGSKLVLSSLADLHVISKSLGTIASLLSYIRLPVAKKLTVTFSNYVSRRVLQTYWATAREACASIVYIHLELWRRYGDPTTPGEDPHPRLTLESLYPCTSFSELRILHVDLGWRVSLTDADLLQLASPHMEKIIINNTFGWEIGMVGDKITLSGLVQLLRQCPSLNELCIAIDTSTFTEIPEGLDVSFPPRKGLFFDFMDSWIRPGFVPGIVSVFATLKLDPSMFTAWDYVYDEDDLVDENGPLSVWEKVRQELRTVSRG